MITKTDISDFFYLEAEAAKKSWEALIKLPIKDRIRKRKAIQSVYLDRDYRESTDERYVLLKLHVGVNLSDFKEGECLILHKENTTSGIECALNSYEGDDTIYIEVFPPKMPAELESYYDVPLILDKALLDLRENVFYKFLAEIKADSEYWKNCIVNTPKAPTYEEKEKCAEELDDTCKEFELKLLPAQREAIINSLAANDYYLIQGPPGTGKSFVLGLTIIEETLFKCHKVIIIGPNHLAINNTLQQVYKFADIIKVFPKPNLIKVGQSYNRPTSKDEEGNYHIDNINILNVNYFNTFEGIWVLGLTPHSLYTRRANYLKCDTLIIDEAGQMTIPLGLMGMIRANKVIFAGDHKQLPPIVSSEELKDEMKLSIFQRIMTEKNCTMLDVSFRMCEPICNFVSDLFYEGEVKPMKVGCGDMILSSDPLFDFHTPIVIHHVDDNGEQTSDKEASFISETIAGFLKKGLPADEIAVLSPFRAQAANVRRHVRKNPDISEEQRKLVVADTIDKMQGQEREVIVFSLVAGDPDYMTDMAEFLYNPNKLNVAFSRAKSKLIIVGNIEQLRKISSVEYPHIDKMLESKYVTMV
jgi:superfamily I DNA and/or RNA helicase